MLPLDRGAVLGRKDRAPDGPSLVHFCFFVFFLTELNLISFSVSNIVTVKAWFVQAHRDGNQLRTSIPIGESSCLEVHLFSPSMMRQIHAFNSDFRVCVGP